MQRVKAGVTYFEDFGKGLLREGLGMNNLVSCQVEGRRMQYSYIFAIGMDVLAMIFADDIVLSSTRRQEVEKKLRQGAEYQ